jgi:hypothetical protein
MRFDRRIRDFALRKRMVTTMAPEWASALYCRRIPAHSTGESGHWDEQL